MKWRLTGGWFHPYTHEQKKSESCWFSPRFFNNNSIFGGPSCEVITWSACGTIGSDQRETTVGTPSRTYSWRYVQPQPVFSGEKRDVPFFDIIFHHVPWPIPPTLTALTAFFGHVRFGSSTQIARKSVGPNEPCKKCTKSSCYCTATAASVGEPGKIQLWVDFLLLKCASYISY